MGEFDAIRPYGDVEVSEVLQRLLRDEELLRTLASGPGIDIDRKRIAP